MRRTFAGKQLELLATKRNPPVPVHIKAELVGALAELLLQAATDSEGEEEDGNEHQDQS